MRILGADPYRSAPELAGKGVELVTLEALLGQSDFVVIACLLDASTRHLIDAGRLALMKPTAFLINVARGAIVDEAALLETLRARRIRAAAIDVFSKEPLPADDPVRSLDNVVLTPHIGYATEDTFRLFYGQMVEDIAAWASGSPIRTIDG